MISIILQVTARKPAVIVLAFVVRIQGKFCQNTLITLDAKSPDTTAERIDRENGRGFAKMNIVRCT